MKIKKRFFSSVIILVIALLLSGCNAFSQKDILKIYEVDNASGNNAYSFSSTLPEHELKAFAVDMAVVSAEHNDTNPAFTSNSAAVFCLEDNEVLYAGNVHEIMNPASITKLMTAYVTLKYGNLNDTVTITEASTITEIGATLIGLQPGDKISLKDLLSCALVNSGNDAAAAIAVHISGSVDEFAKLMTKEAAALGATNTTFKNPHGLTEEGHLTTLYDIYIITRAVFSNEELLSIINQPTYTYTYTLADGTEKTKTIKHTLKYFTDEATVPPEGMTVLGGKTGTTNAAGHCLALFSQNEATGKHYITVVLKAYTRDDLYLEMNQLLELCANDK